MKFQPEILKHGQPYWDEPNYVHQKHLPYLHVAIAELFGNKVIKESIVVRHERVKLNWNKINNIPAK